MANVVKLTTDALVPPASPDELLNAGAYGAGAVLRLQSSTLEAGPFADVSGTGSTPTVAIVAGTRSYTGYDPTGISSTWYRYRVENVGATRLSDWVTAFQLITLYTNLYDVKQDLGKTALTDTADDELLLDYISDVTDFIRGETSREFASVTGTFTQDGAGAIHGGRCLPVPWGVISISLFEVAPNTGGSFETIPSSDFFLRPNVQDRAPGWPATEVWLSDLSSTRYTFPYGFGNARWTGVRGFSLIPARIEGVARRTVVRMYAARQGGQMDIIGGATEGGAPVVSAHLSRRDRMILDDFTVMARRAA